MLVSDGTSTSKMKTGKTINWIIGVVLILVGWVLLIIVDRNQGKVMAFEDIGNRLWPHDPDQFSLWAISQLIKRIRKKMSYFFLDPKLINSVRGQGYRLEVA